MRSRNSTRVSRMDKNVTQSHIVPNSMAILRYSTKALTKNTMKLILRMMPIYQTRLRNLRSRSSSAKVRRTRTTGSSTRTMPHTH
ncbi:hypothetical protein MAR_026333 [Mya arenaria]|uniref:Uncharacterized protein n=1 Tax=Mya arenaria TaxID=6604 RepID=A0ABY7EQC1_MYAAR|nr:hypothetical protein MAR_026333 [Mya arenaria]